MDMMSSIGMMNVRVSTVQQKKRASAGKLRLKTPAEKKPKKLKYNFKEISDQILMSKTSDIANTVSIRARVVVVSLLAKKSTGDYDSTEVEHALIHAKKMARIAKKRAKHLKEEEMAGSGQRPAGTQEDGRLQGMEDREKEEKDKELEEREKELKKLEDEYERMMRETIQEALEDMSGLDELMEDELGTIVRVDMDPEDLERLKKKHRSDELREIMEADMKYLRSVMARLEKEKQEGPGMGGVSLQLSGADVPVDMAVTEAAPGPAVVVMEGGSVDISL